MHWIFFYFRENFEFGIGYVLCEDLLPIGRMSFMNYNPLVQVKISFLFLTFNKTTQYLS